MRRVARNVPGLRRVATTLLGALLLAGVACNDDDDDGLLEPVLETSGTQLASSKLAALAVVIATGAEGAAFLDNFIGCTRRGVINYSNIPEGRRATVAGCNLGDSVVVDGDIEVRWVPASGDRRQIGRIELLGPMTVRIADTTRTIDRAVIENVSFQGTPQALQTARIEQARVTAFGETVTADRRGRFGNVFGPFPLTLNSIPNTAGSPAGLTADDARRLAFQLGTTFQTIVLQESGRPPHQITTPCGTIVVTREPGAADNVVTFNLSECDFGNGLLLGGNFRIDLATAVNSSGLSSYLVTGQLVVGGGVPRLTLDAFEWSIEYPAGLPGDATITMTLVTGQDRWEYAYTIPLDD